MITTIITVSLLATIIVVLIVERTNAKAERDDAYRAGFLNGYRQATAFQNNQPQQQKDQ